MTRLTRYWLARPLFLGLLLAALTLRGLIPIGYMPASGQPFALQLCQVGLTSDDAASGGEAQSHNGADSRLCVFGAAPGAAPAPEYPTVHAALVEISTLPAAFDVPPLETRRYRVLQPRAPPSLS